MEYIIIMNIIIIITWCYAARNCWLTGIPVRSARCCPVCWKEVTFPYLSSFWNVIVNENCNIFVVHAHVCQITCVIQQRQLQYLQVNYVDWAVHSPDAESEADVVTKWARNSSHKTTVSERYSEHFAPVKHLQLVDLMNQMGHFMC